MNITKYKYLLGGGLISCLSLCVLAATGGGIDSLFKANASDAHDSSCYWNHYLEVSPTYAQHGSKEFYACCTHPGSFSLEKPNSENITEMGEFSGDYFSELDSGDGRYLPSLKEGDVLYDATSAWMVPNNYGFRTGDTNLKTDAVYGSYCEISNLTNDSDAVWVRPYESTEDNYELSLDISSYKKYVFYVKSSIDETLIVKNHDWTNLVSSINLVANEWTRIEIEASSNCKKLIDLAPAIWNKHDTPFTLSISSIYGYGKETNLFEGMEVVFDTSENQYIPLNWNISEGAVISNGKSDSMYGYYCEIDVPLSSISEAIWVKPSKSISLDNYSKVVFYIYSSQDMNSFQVRDEDYNLIVNPHSVSKGWNKVEMGVGGFLASTTDIGIAYWKKPVEGLSWKITSIYGIK